MSVSVKASRTQVWLESLGDWSWPGQRAAATDFLPPSWVPTFPPRLEPLAETASASVPWRAERALPRRLGLGAVLSAIASIGVALAMHGPLALERTLGIAPAQVQTADALDTIGSPPATQLPTLTAVSEDAAGSMIDRASYSSAALRGSGSFYVYLPAGYAGTTSHYPVLYLLHGDEQSATAFLQIGLQGKLDRLIAGHVIPPLIAVMVQGGRGPNNWRNFAGPHYESYVLEVQQLIDRMLPTVPARSARAIAGDSMGGYGAMNLALGNPYRFGVVESWIGFFNGLEGDLHADRAIFSRLGLHAFVYGAEEDHIANPAEDPPFAAALRAAGASADSAVYPGEHSLETVEAHLTSMLVFAGRALAR